MIPARWSPRPVRALTRASLTHLAASAAATFWPAVIGCGILVGTVLAATRGAYVDFGGWHPIPTGATR